MKDKKSSREFYDMKKIYSNPSDFKTIVDFVSHDIYADFIYPADSGIMPLAGAVALKTGKKILYIRGEGKSNVSSLKSTVVADGLNGDSSVQIIDDVIGTGKSLMRSIRQIKKIGVKNFSCVVLLNVDSSEEVATNLAKKGIIVNYLAIKR